MSTYNNGSVINTSNLQESEYLQAAKEWSEGNEKLEDLLYYFLQNNIKTQACCVGHENTSWAFLQFEFSKENLKAIIPIIKRYYNTNGIRMIFVNQPGIISKFDIRVPKQYCNQFFGDLLEYMKSNYKNEDIPLLPEMQNTIEVMLNHKVPNDYFETQYTVQNNEKKMFVASSTPNYFKTYWNKPNAISWVENSIGIEGTPAEVNPILQDINNKTEKEYSNYISDKLKNNVVDITTNPFKEKKSLIANVSATIENEAVTKNGYTIVEILPGMRIEQVAKDMVGEKYIGKFNNFEIDGSKYKTPDEIINAYMKNRMEGRKKLEEARKRQMELDQKSRDEQIISSETIQNNEGGIVR